MRRPGNYEVELGVPTRDLIYDLAGGPLPEGQEVKAIYPGGSSSPVLTADEHRPSLQLRGDGCGGLDARLRIDDRRR